MLESPADASNDTGQSEARGTTMVKGPGQKAAASFFASSLNVPKAKAAPASATWEISGLKVGRPLAA